MLTGKAKIGGAANIDKVGRFPSPLLPHKKKLTLEFGYEYALAMYSGWSGKNEDFSKQRRERFRVSKRYRQGMQDVSQYADRLDLQGDNSPVNLNLSPVAIIPYFVDSMVEEISSVSWEVNAKAQDSIATIEEQEIKQNLIANFYKRPVLNKLRESLGMMPEEEQVAVFESIEEIQLYMDLDYKSMVEMAAEIGVQMVLDNNDYNEIMRQVVDDTITYGIAGVYEDLTPNGITIENLEPENMGYSFTKKANFKGIQHGFHFKVMTISDVRRLAPNLSEDDLYDIAKSFAGSYNNPENISKDGYYNSTSNYQEYVYDSFSVTVMCFEFKNEDKLVYGKGSKSFKKKKDTFKGTGKEKKVQKTITNVYKGMWIVNTPYLLNYGLKENIARPNNDLSRAEIGYKFYANGIYKNNFKSIVERMRPFADQIQINHIKIQQLIQKARPSGLLIEVGGLENDVSLDGQHDYTPLELMKVYNQEGHMFYRATDEDGQPTGRPPFTPLTNGIDFQGLNTLIANYNFNLQMMRDVSGFIPERSGHTKTDQLVGVTEEAIRSSLNSTAFVKNAWISITEQVADHTTILLGDVMKYQPSMYGKSLDGMTEEVLAGLYDLPMRELGIRISVEPDQAKKMVLEQNMQAEIAQGNLTTEAAHRIRDIKNLSLAYRVLSNERKKSMRMKQQMAQENIQMQMEQQNAEAQAGSQRDAQKVEAETQSKIAVIQAQMKADIEVEKYKALFSQGKEMEKAYATQMSKDDDFNKQMQKESFKENQKNQRDERNIQARKDMQQNKSLQSN